MAARKLYDHMRIRARAHSIAQKIFSLTLGRAFVSSTGQELRSKIAQPTSETMIVGLRIAVVVHAYYPELLGEALACWNLLPSGTALFVTVPPNRHAEAAQMLAGHSQVHLHEMPNRGRDVAPFVSLLNFGAFDGYDAVLKIHTKRSPHLRDGDIRRQLLFLMLAGEPNATRRALAAFNDPHVGMIGWKASFRTEQPFWMANRPRVEALVSAMKTDQLARLGFFEGSMFWFRPKALEPLRRLNLSVEDFEPEAGQLDGTLHHAVERAFTIAAWSAGYTVRDLRGRLLTSSNY